MTMLGRIARWKLLPLLAVSMGNAVVWAWVVQHGFNPVIIASVALITLIAGAVTANRLRWFTALCLLIPVLMAGNHRHGSLILHLIGGFVYPPLWIYFAMNLIPFLVPCVALVCTGQFLGRQIGLRTMNESQAK